MERGCIQGDIDSPIIFNLIVDAAIRTWNQEAQLGKRSSICFYADDGLLENKNPKQLQRDLDQFIHLFKKVVLKANKIKTKFVVVRVAAAPKAQSTRIYNQQLQRKQTKKKNCTIDYSQKRRQQVQINTCGRWMQQASLQQHMTNQHNTENHKYKCKETTQTGEFRIVRVTKGQYIDCPIPSCEGGGRDKSGLYRHFSLRHPKTDIVIEEDGVLAKCDLCGMRTKTLNRHRDSPTCKQAQRRQDNEAKQEEQHKAD